MASNYPTFELGLFDDIQELDNVSEMVETSVQISAEKATFLREKCPARYCPFLKETCVRNATSKYACIVSPN